MDKNKPNADAESRVTEWSVGEASQLSIGDDASATFIQSQDFQLHLRTKKETISSRTIIPSTKAERLSFYRAYVASPNRKQVLVMQHARFNTFLWLYIFNVFLKSFPHTFVHLFLASYAPDEHIFLPKMVPIISGCKYSLMLAGFFELLTYVDCMVMMMFYTVSSVLYRNPWNRCENETYIDPIHRYIVHCYEINEFAKKFVNDTPEFKSSAYISSENELFQLSQMAYHGVGDIVMSADGFRYDDVVFLSLLIFSLHRYDFARNLFYSAFIWIVAGVCHTRVFTKTFWTVLHRFQWIVNGIDITCLVYLAGYYLQTLLEEKEQVEVPVFPLARDLWRADLDMLVESTTSPPSIHVLTSRSAQPITPSEDSAMIITSNAMCFILRGLLISRVKKYSESVVNAPLHFAESNRNSWFYFYTIFFSTFTFGELFTMGFFAMYFITEMMMLIVVYQCLVEAVIHEWKFIKRWCLAAALTVAAIFAHCTRYVLFIYGTSIGTFFEIIFLYLLYPLGRLIDDYTFHYGVQPTTLRILSLRVVPLYYSYKLYTLIRGIVDVMVHTYSRIFPVPFKWLWIYTVAPPILGIFVVAYRYVLVDRKDWRLMFRPVPNWGPKDFQARQLRKQFDTRNYIGSQYPRLLSRYLLRKAEAESYKLDLRYDTPRTSAPRGQEEDLRFINEKLA